MKTRLLLKASEEQEDFKELIGIEVTFASDIITIGGSISNCKGDKAIISDVQYSNGYYSNLCPDIYIKPKISTFEINHDNSYSWKPQSFIEYKTQI